MPSQRIIQAEITGQHAAVSLGNDTALLGIALEAPHGIGDNPSSGKVSAADVAQLVFDAVAANQFYIYSHPKAIKSVQTRLEDIVQTRNPTDPFAGKPEVGQHLKDALRAA